MLSNRLIIVVNGRSRSPISLLTRADKLVQAVQMGELLRKHEALVLSNAAAQCALQTLQFAAQFPLGQVGHPRWIMTATH
jgi:hypothetical protein